MQQPLKRRRLLIPFALMAAAALTGCAPTSVYSDLERAAEEPDVLPVSLVDEAAEWLVPESVRFAGEDAGVQFYLGVAASDGAVCAVAYRSALAWVGVCGDEASVDGEGMTFRLVRDSTELEAGWSRVGENIQVKSVSG